MDGTTDNEELAELGQRTLQANREHTNALTTYIQTLEAELKTLDTLIDDVNDVDESDLEVGSSVTIPDSVRATAPITAKELLSPEFPFHQDALKRSRYQSSSEVRPMKPKELEALAEAVQAESYRNHALYIQKRGCLAFPNIDTQTAHVLGLDAEGIDWDRVAETVSTVCATTRTARECEIRWLGEQHPEFNHDTWSKEEVLRVKSLTAEFKDGLPDWVVVAKRLGTKRTPLDCMRHATSRKTHQWTTEADERLLKATRMYGHDNWHLVARYVSEDVTPSQCSSRFEKTLDESVKHTAWSAEEDARLAAAVAAYGSSWVDVAANMPGRHNDQCRERWIDQVNPSINKNKTRWSEEEDRALVDYVREQENASWKEISEHVGNGRTEDMCRHRHAVLHKDTNLVATTRMSTVDSEMQVTLTEQAPMPMSSAFAPSNSSILFSETSFSHEQSNSRNPILPPADSRQPNQLVFLEPMVSSDPRLHSYHRPRPSQRPVRFKSTTVGKSLPSEATTMPPSKKRKTRPRISKPAKPTAEAQPNGSGG